MLDHHFGRYGLRLHELSRGDDNSEVVPARPTQSMSVEDTYEGDVPVTGHRANDPPPCRKALVRFAQRITDSPYGRPQTEDERIQDPHSQHTPDFPPSSCEELTDIALALRERVDLDPKQRFRLVGVGLGNFREPEDSTAQTGSFRVTASVQRLEPAP